MPPEITQDHMDMVKAAAIQIAQTPLGALADPEELESQGGLILWELALTYDPEKSNGFGGYLWSLCRLRLIDWLRREYGDQRSPQGRAKLQASFQVQSMDDVDRPYHQLPASDSVEETILAREQVREMRVLINDVCTDKERDALLWPVTDESTAAAATRLGTTVNAVGSHRSHARAKVAAALNETPLS